MSNPIWGIKLPIEVRGAMKRLANENYNYPNIDCVYDDVRVLDREIGRILKEGVICKCYKKENDE